jgi:hypothetical protein
MRHHTSSHGKRRQVEIRLAGDHDDVTAVLVVLGAVDLGGWNLELKTVKHREGGLVHAYAWLVKEAR